MGGRGAVGRPLLSTAAPRRLRRALPSWSRCVGRRWDQRDDSAAGVAEREADGLATTARSRRWCSLQDPTRGPLVASAVNSGDVCRRCAGCLCRVNPLPRPASRPTCRCYFCFFLSCVGRWQAPRHPLGSFYLIHCLSCLPCQCVFFCLARRLPAILGTLLVCRALQHRTCLSHVFSLHALYGVLLSRTGEKVPCQAP